MSDIVQNAIEVSGEVYLSRSRHDFVSFNLPDGEQAYIDGGLDYIRASANIEPFVQKGMARWLLVDTNSSFQDKLDKLVWGTRGSAGDNPVKYVYLRNCTLSHLQAISQIPGICPHRLEIIRYLLKP